MAQTDAVQLTAAGRKRLVDELDHLKHVKLPELRNQIHDLNDDGDISDNSEYEEDKEELVLVTARIHELELLLENAIEVAPSAPGTVGLGRSVTIRDDEGAEESWQLVSPEEADTRLGTISTDSPVGHALIGRKVGDSTTVETPAGSISYTIVSVD